MAGPADASQNLRPTDKNFSISDRPCCYFFYGAFLNYRLAYKKLVCFLETLQKVAMTDLLKTPAELKFGGSWRIIIPLFLIPLAIVVSAVGVFFLFGKLTSYQKSPQQYMTEMLSTNSHKRWQAAFELSRLVIQKDKYTLEPEFESDLIKIYQSSDPKEQRLRTYLTIVLAHVGKESSSKLFEKVLLESTNSEDQIYALWAIGKVGSPSSADLVVSKLDSEDSGLRKTAAFSLGFVGNLSHVQALEKLLKDDVNDVRWNAALSLAELGSSAGKVEILNLLNKDFILAQTPSLREDERSEIVISALNAARRIKLKEALPSIATWSQSANARLRNLALEVNEELSSKL